VRFTWSLPLVLSLTALSLQGGCSFGYDLTDVLTTDSGGGDGDGDVIGDGDGDLPGGAPGSGGDKTGDGDGDGDTDSGGRTGGGGDDGSGGDASGGDNGSGGDASGGDDGAGGDVGSGGDEGSGGDVGAGGDVGSGGASGGAGTGGAGTGGSGSGGATTTNLVVTTTADEQDASASPGSPGQSGFSLREAILFANNQAGSETVTFSISSKVVLTSALPDITGGLTVNGNSPNRNELDATAIATSTPCLTVTSSGVSINLLTLSGCKGEPIRLTNTATGSSLNQNLFTNNAGPVTIYADDAMLLLNGVQTTGGTAISLFGQRVQVFANVVNYSPGVGIMVNDNAHDPYLLANVIYNVGTGISLGDIDRIRLFHNTINASGVHGINMGAATLAQLVNNIITGSGQYGVLGSSSQFTLQDYNLFYQNGSGTCSACPLGSHSVTSDPRYTNAGANDFTLQTGSPAIDAGQDMGVDRTPSNSGNLFNGTAPDIGYIEK